jgi:branched-chain amino acid transport system ATP-binding protein
MKEALRIEHLSITFGGLKALDDLSFTVYDKEIFGLIGPNGAGKTTLFNCITQFYRPDHGDVLFSVDEARRGRRSKLAVGASLDEPINLVGLPVHSVIGFGLVRTFQNVEVIPELSVIDNVLIGAHGDFSASMLSQMLRLPKSRREERLFREKAMESLRFLGIEGQAGQLAGGQPYGTLKKIEMARTLMSDPRLIILDEPAAGLNESETEWLAGTIRQIRDQHQCTILLVEHDMGLVMAVCDRICAISFGKFLALGTPGEIQQNKLVHEAYLGESDDD